MGGKKDKVAAGINPAAMATLVTFVGTPIG